MGRFAFGEVSVIALSVAVLPAVAAAQSDPTHVSRAAPDSNAIAEVVVTARKQSESLQRIPLAVTAATGEQLQRQNVRTVQDLGHITPSLQIDTGSQTVTGVSITLRGQAPGASDITLSQPVGIYEDYVNIPHPIGVNGSFFDIERVEVLKGPQGTLYGKNTTGGAINIITRNADYVGVHGFVGAEGGDHGDWRVNGAVNLPIIPEVLAVRLAGEHWKRDGVGQTASGERIGFDHDDSILRASIRFDPSAQFSSTTKAEYLRMDRNGTDLLLYGMQPGGVPSLEVGFEAGCSGFPTAVFFNCANEALAPALNNKSHYDSFATGPSYVRDRIWHLSHDMSWTFSDKLSLRSITGYHQIREQYAQDTDGTPFQIIGINNPLCCGLPNNPIKAGPYQTDYSLTQEFDLAGKAFNGRLNYLAGVFGSWDSGHQQQYTEIFPLLLGSEGVAAQLSSVKSRSKAVYGQADFKITDKLSITGGLRYTEEHQSDVAPQWTYGLFTGLYNCLVPGGAAAAANPASCPVLTNEIRSHGLSYLASLNYQATDRLLFYVKTAKGFRAGALQSVAPGAKPVLPEQAADVEIGMKGDFLHRRLRLNLAAYRTNYDNKQEQVTTSDNSLCGPGVFNGCQLLENAANARIWGAEAEATGHVTDRWTLYGTLTWLKGTYLSFNNPLGQTGPLFPGAPCNPAGGVTPNPLPAQCILHDVPFALPSWQGSVGSRYEFDLGPGRLAAQLDLSWRARQHANFLNVDPSFPANVYQAQLRNLRATQILNGRLEYNLPDFGVTLALFATNMLDKQYRTVAPQGPPLNIYFQRYSEPRMWGAQVRKSFGGG